MSSGAEPASRLVRLLRQLEATCNAHADAALSRNRSGMAGHGQTMHRAPAAVPSAAGLTLAACRGSHVQAGPFLLAGARYQPGTAASLLLGRAARSSRFAGAPMPQQARHSGLTARLHSGLSTASGAAPASRPQGGGQQPPPPKGSPSRHVWQQERGRSWAAANAVQPAAAGVPAVQYAPRYQPQRHEHFALPNAPQPRPQQQAQPPALRPTAPPPAVFEQRAQPGAQMQGLVQRVTYHSQETGYCVLKLQPDAGFSAPPSPPGQASGRGGSRHQGRGRPQNKSLVTVTGIFRQDEVNSGMRLRFTGHWVNHKTYGQQLNANRLEDLEPNSSRSLIAYLGGGAIAGVGPVTARRMVDGLGDSVLDILDGAGAEALLQRCEGIGAVTAAKICRGWAAGRGTRDSVKFLHDLGLTMAQAQQVVNQLGEDTERLVREDPYRAMRKGVLSFKVADNLAAQLGTSPGLPSRGAAAIAAELLTAMRRGGHCYLPWGQLQHAALTMLLQTGRPWPEGESLEAAARDMVARGRLVAESAAEPPTLREEWAVLEPANAALGSKAVGAAELESETAPAAVLRRHLEAHVNGVGPAAAKRLFRHFANAERLMATFDAPASVGQLCRCSGIKELTARKMKQSWDKTRALLDKALAAAAAAERSAASSLPVELPIEDATPWDDATRCYAPDMYRAETVVAATLTRVAAQPRHPIPAARHASGTARVEAWMNSNEGTTKVKLSDGQREAIRQAANAPIMVLTGGPGCGKTFATATIVKLWRAMSRGHRIALCAPTGRAAERLASTARYPATTIHRLLRVQGRSSRSSDEDDGADASGSGSDGVEAVPPRFEFHAGNPLKLDALLVDEASMLDLPLAAALLDALPRTPTFRLVLVGDADQLPPVGPGSVLRAIIESGVVPVVDLRRIFRQAEASTIVTAAHQVNAGIVPTLDPILSSQLQTAPAAGGSAQWVRVEERGGAAGVEAAAIEAVMRLQASGMDVAKDLQVLSPMKKGPAGTRSLNVALQALLNPPAAGKAQVQRRGSDPSAVFRVGDRVIQVVNDYERDVFNGDQGFVTGVSPDGALEVTFPPASGGSATGGANGGGSGVAAAGNSSGDGGTSGAANQAAGSADAGGIAIAGAGSQRPPLPRAVQYLGRQMDALELAWVTTVHKAQGGESHAVLMCLAPSHRPLLSRRLFYTGLTRAKELAVLVATPSALQTAVREAPGGARASCLQPRFRLGALAAGAAEQQPQQF